MGKKREIRVIRRVRNNHGSMLVTLPPELAEKMGITYGDYVILSHRIGSGKVELRTVEKVVTS